MKSARRRAVLISVLGAILLASLIFLALAERPAAPPKRRPTLLLLTSLPIIFNEDFSLDGGGSPALSALGRAYRVVPISVTSSSELARGDVLLMAHARAQTAENLVALDSWVRRGGRVLILADPLLEWPSSRPLGDPLRPSPMFMDTGLLSHWGLRLDAADVRGNETRKLGSFDIVTASPGRLEGSCDIRDDGLDARCAIGKGEAIIIADADFLNAPALGKKARHNLDALVEQLARLTQE